MNSDESDKLEEIHGEVREMRTDVEVVKEQTRINGKYAERIDNRVFGPHGVESQVQANSEAIGRLNGIGVILTGALSTLLAKLFNIFP